VKQLFFNALYKSRTLSVTQQHHAFQEISVCAEFFSTHEAVSWLSCNMWQYHVRIIRIYGRSRQGLQDFSEGALCWFANLLILQSISQLRRKILFVVRLQLIMKRNHASKELLRLAEVKRERASQSVEFSFFVRTS
jgi:hypothetical protein